MPSHVVSDFDLAIELHLHLNLVEVLVGLLHSDNFAVMNLADKTFGMLLNDKCSLISSSLICLIPLHPLEIFPPFLNPHYLVIHLLDFPDADRFEALFLLIDFPPDPFLQPLHCLELHIVPNNGVFLMQQITNWHHKELSNINSEPRINCLNLLEDL